MASISLSQGGSIVLAVDLQPVFIREMFEADRLLRRSEFLIGSAALLGIPILATEQSPGKLGSLLPNIGKLAGRAYAKTSFSCWNAPDLRAELKSAGRKQIIIVGLETHICIAQSAQDLLENGFDVVVCPDAVSAGSSDRHKLGMERIRDAGCVPSHTEGVVYEWLGSADHPGFSAVLALVKEFRDC